MRRVPLAALWLMSGLIILNGCTATRLSQYPRDVTSELEAVDPPPSPSLVAASRQRARVILLWPEGRNANGEVSPALAKSFADLVGAGLAKKNVEILDRSLGASLDAEIKACEVQGRDKCGASSVEPSVARFAVKASVTSAFYSADQIAAKEEEGGTWTATRLWAKYGSDYVTERKIGKDRTVYIVRPHTIHNVKVSTVVKAYELPGLREIGTWSGEESLERKTDSGARDVKTAMLEEAVAKTVPSGRTLSEIANLFAPKAYVIGARTDESGRKLILMISVGRSQGVRKGMDVVFYRPEQVTDRQTSVDAESSPVLVDVAEGKVSDLIEDDTCWIEPNDQSSAKKVRIGDPVSLKHCTALLCL